MINKSIPKSKLPDLLKVIREKVANGEYVDTYHANERQIQRKITLPEILYVLKNGRHEKRKDKYEEKYDEWNYSIRGKTVNKRELRIIISFDENKMLIITAITLDP